MTSAEQPADILTQILRHEEDVVASARAEHPLDALRLVAGALAALGCEHALVVHSRDGLDEISLGAATDAPAPAATSAAAVEMLKVLQPSPPVPQLSTSGARDVTTRSACARIVPAAATTTSTVSPRVRSAARNAPTRAGDAAPVMIASNAAAASACSSATPSHRRISAARSASAPAMPALTPR